MILFSGTNINICKRIYKQVYKPLHMQSGRDYRYKSVVLHIIYSKYSVPPHISDTHMSFSPPPANASGGYTLI